jgi:hypothetical protein
VGTQESGCACNESFHNSSQLVFSDATRSAIGQQLGSYLL